jgi:transcriptional regulator with XRE-family HTH domain
MEKNHETDLKIVGGRIRAARQRLGLTQEKAAERTDITGQYWSLLETGRERGSVSTYLQIAAALDLTLDDIFYEEIGIKRTEKGLLRGDILVDCTAEERQIISETVYALKSALRRTRER